MKIPTTLTAILLVASSLLAANASGAMMTGGKPLAGAPAAGQQSGTVEAVTPGSFIRISGVDYVYSQAAAKVHDAAGNPVPYMNLAQGSRVRFTTRLVGSRETITELWMDKK